MREPIELMTFTTKYDEQIIAIKGKPGSMNFRLFDAVPLWMDAMGLEDGPRSRERVLNLAFEWATAFVNQMNAGSTRSKTALENGR